VGHHQLSDSCILDERHCTKVILVGREILVEPSDKLASHYLNEMILFSACHIFWFLKLPAIIIFFVNEAKYLQPNCQIKLLKNPRFRSFPSHIYKLSNIIILSKDEMHRTLADLIHIFNAIKENE
jgi:hypothetical protein